MKQNLHDSRSSARRSRHSIRVTAIGLAMVVILVASACGDDDESTANTAGSASVPEGADQTTISEWEDPRAAWEEEFSLFGPPEIGDGSLKSLQEDGKVLICNQVGVTPILFKDEQTGALIGYNDELAQEFTRRLGIDSYEYVDIPFASFIPAVQGGQCDFSMGDMAATVERESGDGVKFAYPYVVYVAQWVVPEDSPATAPDELEGRLAATTGSLESLTIEAGIKEGTYGGELVTFEGADEAYLALSQGSVDAVLGEPTQNQSALDKFKGLKVIDEDIPYVVAPNETDKNPYTQISVAPLTAEEDGDLNQALAVVVAEMHEDGTMERILEKWGVLYSPRRTEVVRPEVLE